MWVNALWFLSLVISLTTALLATFLQQWARRYLKLTQTRYKRHKRSRVRAFFAEGVDKCLLPWAVEILPTLLHISLFLFFAGLVVFLLNVNLTIFKVVVSCIGICAAVYGCITLMPIIRHDSPYCTSLSSSVWYIVMGMAYYVSGVSGLLLYCTVFGRHGAEWLFECAEYYSKSLSHGMQKTAEETALKSSSEIDTRAFMWTFESLDEDHELERFFAGLPGFRSSKVVDDPLPKLSLYQMWILRGALDGLLRRTLSSDFLPDSVKIRRAMIVVKALDLKHFPDPINMLETILFEFKYRGPLATDIAESLRGWRIGGDEGTTLTGQAIISEIVARTQPRDDSWFTLASKELCVTETVLRDYAAHGNSLSLAVLIYVTRQQFIHFANQNWIYGPFSFVLFFASEFDVEDTSPELQHQFCALWNQVVRKAQDNHDQDMAFFLLRPICQIYIALHEGTDSAPRRFSAFTFDTAKNSTHIQKKPSSYPLCKVPDHHPDWTTPYTGIRDDFYHTFSSPESRSSMLVPTAQRSSLSFAGDSGATAMREDTEMAASPKGKEKAVPFPIPAINDDFPVTVNVPSRSPSPQPFVDVTSTVLSPSSLDAEREHGQYDLV